MIIAFIVSTQNTVQCTIQILQLLSDLLDRLKLASLHIKRAKKYVVSLKIARYSNTAFGP